MTGDAGLRPAGAILAGGRALRFGGRPKGLELIGGVRIIDRVASALRDIAGELLLIGAPPVIAATLPDWRLVPDASPGDGPLGAIVTALGASGRDTLIVAWDMPFVTAADLQPLLHAPSDADAVLWQSEGRVEPLCGLYRATALPALAAAFAGGERSPRATLGALRLQLVTRAETDESSPFASINTSEQLDAARRAGPPATR